MGANCDDLKRNDYNNKEIDCSFGRINEQLFGSLFEKYWKQSHSYVRLRVWSDEIAKEIVQEVFADIWSRRQNLQIQDFERYLFTALKNKTINHINSVIRHRKYWEYYSNFIPNRADQTQHDVEYQDLKNSLERSLFHLPEKTQQVFRLNRLEGKSLAEISKTLNLTEKAIQYHLTKSLKLLRIYLRDYIPFIVYFILYFDFC